MYTHAPPILCVLPLCDTSPLNFLITVSHVAPLLRQAVKHQPRLQSDRQAPSLFTLRRLPQTSLSPSSHNRKPARLRDRVLRKDP